METKPTNPKDALGIKKPPLHCLSGPVVFELGLAMLEGARKYGSHNYRSMGVRASVYFDAAMRHLWSWWEGEDVDPDSGQSHLIKAMACLLVVRDSQIIGNWVDDRPIKNPIDMNKLSEAVKILQEKYPKCAEPFIQATRKTKVKPKISMIYCDMDGVLVDFVGGINKALRITPHPYMNKSPWNWYREHGFTDDQVNAVCTEDFWANLEWTKDGKVIYSRLVDTDLPIHFLSAPMKDVDASTKGKKRWLRRYLKGHPSRIYWLSPVVTGRPKEYFAIPDALLIDDKDDNVDGFRAAGGQAILIARPWNSRWKDADKAYELFVKELNNVLDINS